MNDINTVFNLNNFIRTAHYFATVASTVNYYQETITVLEQFFKCDTVCFVQKTTLVEMIETATTCEPHSEEFLTLCETFIEDVLASGFLRCETIFIKGWGEMTFTFLPITLFNHSKLALCVGYSGNISLNKEALNILLAISTLLSTFLEKQTTKKSFEALYKEHQMILLHAGDGIMGIDRKMRHTFVNPVAAGLLGFTAQEMINQDSHDLWHYKHTDGTPFERSECKIHIAFEKGEKCRSSDEVFIRKDGTFFPVEVTVTPIIEEESVQGAVIIFKDITERKKVEEALKASEMELLKARDELEERVNLRTKELQDANSKLKELDQLKSMFIASMSHELRTPLNSIIGFSTVILNQLIGPITEKQHDYLERVKRAGEHLLSLITDVIDISKIEAGILASEFEPFALKKLFDEAIDAVILQAEKKGIKAHYEMAEEFELYTDRRRLFQCLLNYLSNAVKFSEGGEVFLKAIKVGERLKISVQDTGIGIPPKDLPKLFEAFERLESHLKVKAGGSGLGLYLTKKITENILQGEVGMESIFGKGSTFWLIIPLTVKQIEAEK